MKDHGLPIALGVNIDHVATLRQSRGTSYPEPVEAALISERAGAAAITVHLREDRRHIQERDVRLLAEVLQTRMNLEMAVADDIVAFAEALRPADCCLVPERREELTTEGGLDVIAHADRIGAACERLTGAGCRVSLFIDPDPAQVAAAATTGCRVIEIHTGHFADAADHRARERELDRIRRAVELGLAAGLQVNAGHGLNYHNVGVIAALPGISELNIGHAIIARAVFTGLETAVREMLLLMREARRS